MRNELMEIRRVFLEMAVAIAIGGAVFAGILALWGESPEACYNGLVIAFGVFFLGLGAAWRLGFLKVEGNCNPWAALFIAWAVINWGLGAANLREVNRYRFHAHMLEAWIEDNNKQVLAGQRGSVLINPRLK